MRTCVFAAFVARILRMTVHMEFGCRRDVIVPLFLLCFSLYLFYSLGYADCVLVAVVFCIDRYPFAVSVHYFAVSNCAFLCCRRIISSFFSLPCTDPLPCCLLPNDTLYFTRVFIPYVYHVLTLLDVPLSFGIAVAMDPASTFILPSIVCL